MHKLILLSVVALSFGGCYTKLASDGDYWGYTGRAKRDKVVIIKERTDTVIVTSQDTIVTEPAAEPATEPEKTIIINNYYPDYSIYAVRPFGFRPWYPRPSVSFSITFGDPYPYYYPVYHHRHYWSWWDRPWYYYDPYYCYPYYSWYSPYYDPWWGWGYDPYTCLRPTVYPGWYYDHHYFGHHYYDHEYDNGNDYRDHRRRGRTGGEDRAGNTNSVGSGTSRAGKVNSTPVSTALPGNATAVRISKEPEVQIVTDNTEGIRTSVPTEVTDLSPSSEKNSLQGPRSSNVTSPNTASGSSSSSASTKKTATGSSSSGSARAADQPASRKSSVVYTSRPGESSRASESTSRNDRSSSENSPRSPGSSSGSSSSSSPRSSGSYSGGSSQSSGSGSSSSGSQSSSGSSSGSGSSSSGRASRSSR